MYSINTRKNVYWDAVINEVLNKNTPDYVFWYTNLGDLQHKSINKNRGEKQKKRDYKYYSLGGKYEGIAFTAREARCMVHFIHGKTIASAAQAQGLSPRTVEYYLSLMKRKANCSTKSELITKVLESDFLAHVDF